jgi:[acyl-carrier-protein] S-malonyltransferase
MKRLSRPFAAVFPGQGSQAVGMLGNLAEANSIVQETFAEAASQLDFDLWELVKNGPETQLNQTEYTQPALLAAGVAIWRIWCAEVDVWPVMLAGHSLGEYTALVCAESIAFKDAIRLARLRGQLMQNAVQSGAGAMAAIIGLPDQNVEAICDEASADGTFVRPANYNADGQLVIAGTASAVERAVELAKAAGAKMAKLLNVSVPSHCELMKPMAAELAQALESIEVLPPKIPVIHNVDASSTENPAEIRALLVRQVYQPVRWTATLRKLAGLNVQLLIECGPGKVLTGLAKRTAPVIPCWPVYDEATLQEAIPAVRQLT